MRPVSMYLDRQQRFSDKEDNSKEDNSVYRYLLIYWILLNL